MESPSTTFGVAILPATLWRLVSVAMIFPGLPCSLFSRPCAVRLSYSCSSVSKAHQRLPEAQRRRVIQAEKSNAKERQEEERTEQRARDTDRRGVGGARVSQTEVVEDRSGGSGRSELTSERLPPCRSRFAFPKRVALRFGNIRDFGLVENIPRLV